MLNFEKMYFHLFNEVSAAIDEMNHCNYGAASERLIHAQLVCEEMFLQEDDEKGARQEASPERKANTRIVLLP